jgi:very-short-patch-repair endonuclease
MTLRSGSGDICELLTLEGSHFRRQVPIGPYVVDFACMAAHLLIELDGSQHSDSVNALRDEARTRWLEKEGFRVIRIWNNEIVQNINGVLERIYAEIFGSLETEHVPLKHLRRKRVRAPITPPRALRARPSPSRGG